MKFKYYGDYFKYLEEREKAIWSNKSLTDNQRISLRSMSNMEVFAEYSQAHVEYFQALQEKK